MCSLQFSASDGRVLPYFHSSLAIKIVMAPPVEIRLASAATSCIPDDDILACTNSFLKLSKLCQLPEKLIKYPTALRMLCARVWDFSFTDNYPLITAFRNSCTFSDFPMGSNRNIKRLMPAARYVAGCLSFPYFHAPKNSIPIISTCVK